MPIVAFCPSPRVGRRLQIYRGVHPVMLPPALRERVAAEPGQPGSDATEVGGQPTACTAMRLMCAVSQVAVAVRLGLCAVGDVVVLLAEEQSKGVMGPSVSMRVVTVKG